MATVSFITTSSGVHRLPPHHGGLGGKHRQRSQLGCQAASVPGHQAPRPYNQSHLPPGNHLCPNEVRFTITSTSAFRTGAPWKYRAFTVAKNFSPSFTGSSGASTSTSYSGLRNSST